MRMRAVAMLVGLGLAMCGAGCKSVKLDPEGPYAGDTILYTADQTIVQSWEILYAFLEWETEHHEALKEVPEIGVAADYIMANIKDWYRSAYALKAAYEAAPTDGSRADLEKVLRVLRTAMVEAAMWMAKEAGKE